MEFLGVWNVNNNKELREHVISWLTTQVKNSYEKGIQTCDTIQLAGKLRDN